MQRNGVIWFTGLSGAGKTTLAQAYSHYLQSKKIRAAHLDGDILRDGLCSDLGFESADRAENLRRAAHVARILADNNSMVIASFISPYDVDRERVQSIIGEQDFLLVYLDASLEVCQNRDVKGFYAKALTGEIKKFTGISDSYEVPKKAVVIDTDKNSIDSCIAQLHSAVKCKFNLA